MRMPDTAPPAGMVKMRRIATGLLVLMAVVFVAARLLQPRYPWLSFVVAFAEAAMVGALADWFAVTALFRHPLGLPIPHTAIVPANKDRIGSSVADFLENNFMTREVLAEELRHIDFAGAAAHWLSEPGNSRDVALQITRGVPTVVRMVEDQDVGSFLQSTLSSGLKNVRFGPLLAEVLDVLVADRRHQQLFDHLVGMAATALERNQDTIRQKIHDASPRWMPRIIDEKLFEKIMTESQAILDEMRQEDSEWRERFHRSVQEFMDKLRSSPDYEARIAGVVDQTLQHPLFKSYTHTVWTTVRDRLLADADKPDSRIAAQFERALAGVGNALQRDAAVQDKLNGWIRQFAANAISSRRHLIASLVKRVIQKWDAETVSRKFESYVGRDLQYIRINGTLVGGLVGLLLHLVSMAL
ncbi:DUF445 domain-containing protein [Noviherbaspirillum suwonense]|uniref:Uncharacterized membrane-anchored protein YjiN, DUF445 family n=1 Tax=Noviherbaspirillum suwonense TaxID=1224511 RepID=A0ABY1PU69_9BURK|nr:DUF445 domain-containing protein [Noviherbaspirillum suwonense]SMP46113.1 Uncharacterized membrane-anchored protein YjiN, DUF445 family [Noviherbaspirillum suwonense]